MTKKAKKNKGKTSPPPTERLSLNTELLLAEAYFFAQERGFTDDDEEMMTAFNKMVASFEKRFEASGYKQAKASKDMGMSVITFWRRMKSRVWKKKKQVQTLIKLLHAGSQERPLV